MFQREEVERILKQARQMDSQYEMFGASTHQYRLNPPVDWTFLCGVEKKYHFTLPKDYVQFITEIGDGGAGPGYGIYPFGNFMREGKTPRIEKSQEAYRNRLARPFTPQPMQSEEAKLLAEEFGFDKESYEKNPGEYFMDENNDGFLDLGTRGCEWNFGLIISGERYGQVFDTDREGIYRFTAYSFREFYQKWLDSLSDVEQFQKELEGWRRRHR